MSAASAITWVEPMELHVSKNNGLIFSKTAEFILPLFKVAKAKRRDHLSPTHLFY